MSTLLPRLAALAPLFLLAAACASTRVDGPLITLHDVGTDPQTSDVDGAAHGFPALRTLQGARLGDGEFTQWLEGGRLHLRIRYDLGSAHWIEETSVIQQEPTLVQEQWAWVETREGELQRRFQVDFLARTATAEKLEEHKIRRWSEHLDIEPGRAFAGAAWALAVRGARARLLDGETIRLQTVGFTPSPKAAVVEISHGGLDLVPMAGRTLLGDRFVIHPKIPWIVRAFVDVPDSRLWLTSPAPAAFLRFEGPLAEPGDSIIRVDLLPGEPSEKAIPAIHQDH